MLTAMPRASHSDLHMLSDELITETKFHFPSCDTDRLTVTALEKGGSDRKFFRLTGLDIPPLILVQYSGNKEENRHYVDLGLFLAEAGVQVPKIHFHDPAKGLIWMQDLGDEDLWASRHEDWTKRRPLYESALQQVFTMHSRASALAPGRPLQMEREFNEQLYLWEQNYFLDHCLGAVFGIDKEALATFRFPRTLEKIAHCLAALPRVIVHRDFQSQNILIIDGSAWLIDFQGMRPGLPQYDLASLLYDPYVPFQDSERKELMTFYKNLWDSHLDPLPDYEEVFRLCALQRLMQALGAYGFLGLTKGRTSFLSHIPAARASLTSVVSSVEGLEDLASLLEELPRNPHTVSQASAHLAS